MILLFTNNKGGETLPITKDVLIKHFSDRFLSLEEGLEVGSIADILNLPLSVLKDSNEDEVATFGNYGLKTIRDLSQVKPAKMDEIAASGAIDPTHLKKFFIASKLISRAWQKRSSYAKKETMKVVVVGLDNAGKTTLIDLLSGKKLSEVLNQSPTSLVNQVNISTQQTNIMAWDFGGQTQYRETYLQNPEEYFLGLDLVLFVIDTQDVERYDEALGYFTQLVEIITFLGEVPHLLVLLHKADPEFREDPEFQINLEYLHGKVHEVLGATNYGLDIVTSSIYSTYHSQPQLVEVLKDMFKTNQVTDANVLILDAMMKLTDILVEIGNTMVNMQQNILSSLAEISVNQARMGMEAAPAAGSTEGMEIVKPPPTPVFGMSPFRSSLDESQDDANRGELLSELKELFRKKGLTHSGD